MSKWERAESSPDTDNLIALSQLYGTTIDEMLNGENAGKSKVQQGSIGWFFLPIDRKKAYRIASFVFLGLSFLFIVLGSAFFIGFSVPEIVDSKLARNDSITPINAEVTYKIETATRRNYESMYRVVFAWSEGGVERVGQSNPAYSEAEAQKLVGKTVQIRVDGGRAVMIDYQKSVLSLVGNILFGVFGGLGVLFMGLFTLMHILNKRLKDNDQ